MYTFESRIDYETIIVAVKYEGTIIEERKFSSVTFTQDSAIETLQFDAEHFGFYVNGQSYPASIITPEPDPPSNPLQENIDGVTSSLTELNESLSPDMFNIDIESQFMSDDEVLKKMIISQSSSIPEERIGDDTADQIVAAYPKNHPTRTFIKDKKKEVKTAAKELGFKGKELTDGITQLTIETIASFVTIGSSAVIMPPGAGVPTAFSAVQGLFASLKAFQTKLNQLQPVLEPLKYVEMLVPEGSSIISSINTALGAVNGIVSGVAGVTAPISTVQSLLGSTSVPGVNAPPGPIDSPVLVWGNNNNQAVAAGTAVWIGSNPKGGDWKYKYWWTADNPNDPIINSNAKAVTVYPTKTTKYSVGVSNEDGSGTQWGSWTVVVA